MENKGEALRREEDAVRTGHWLNETVEVQTLQARLEEMLQQQSKSLRQVNFWGKTPSSF